MNRAELEQKIEVANRIINDPQHNSPFQIKVARKLKSKTQKKLDQCPLPKPNPQLRLSI